MAFYLSSELSSQKLQDVTACAAKAKEEQQRSTEFYSSEEFKEAFAVLLHF